MIDDFSRRYRNEIEMLVHWTRGHVDRRKVTKELKRYIEEQLVFFPNSMKVLCQWIITAGDLFESVIIKNEIPITDMPPASQTALDNCMDEDVVKKWETMKGNLLGAAFRELELCSDMYSLPNHNDLIACSRESPLDWNPDTNFEKHTGISRCR